MLNDLDQHFVRHYHYGNAGIRLNARVSMAGYERALPGRYLWHGLKRGSQDFLLWQYTLDGAGLLTGPGETHVLKAGDAMLLKIPGDHCYTVAPGEDHWEFVFVILRGSECLRIGEEVINECGMAADIYRDDELLAVANEILTQQGEHFAALSTLAYSFVMTLADKARLGGGGVPEQLRIARKYALEHFADNLQAGDLAQAANMSYGHFNREFTRAFAVSPGVYLLQLQLEKAVNLLQNSTLNMKEIALASGFSNASYFCRAFKKKYLVSPGDFRKKR